MSIQIVFSSESRPTDPTFKWTFSCNNENTRSINTSVGTTGETGDMSPVAFQAQGTRNAFVPCDPVDLGNIFALILSQCDKKCS